MKRLLSVVGICVLLVSATGARAYGAEGGDTKAGDTKAGGASAEATCAALQSFTDDSAITNPKERLAAGRARLREAQKAANKSGDRTLIRLTRRFRVAFVPAVDHPNKEAAQRALNEAGAELWTYCTRSGFPIRRTTTETTVPPATS